MMRLAAVLSVLFWATSFAARAAAPATVEIPRKAIAFYDPVPGIALHQSPVHQHLEVVLNHLGLDVEHRPTTGSLPSDGEMAGVRAIVSWFFNDRAVPDPDAYCAWIARQMAAGVKWVSLNKLGLFGTKTGDLSPACETLFENLGAEFSGEQTEDSLFLEIVSKDPGMVEFERRLSFADGLRYARVIPTSEDLRCYLTMRRTDLDGADSCLVFATPRGGFVQATFVTYEDKGLDKIKWRINPFRFFAEALDLQGLPAPDVTTLNGRRVFMSRVDGDGIFNVSNIDRRSYSGEIIRKEIFEAYPGVPISASLITGYFDTPEFAGDREIALYHGMFALPNVEPASHGHAHPLVWAKNTAALEIPGYRVDAKFEIQGSTEKMRRILGDLGVAKPVETFFWTGDCLPTEEQLGFSDEAGLLAMNGGDSRYDRVRDSYAFLKPIGLKRGARRQIYAGFGNENVFTNLWHGPYYGYRDVKGSFDRTESPIRLKPIDVYYHFYSGERLASLIELKKAYDHALTGDVFPVFGSRYVLMARDFFRAKLYRIPSGYRMENEGHLRTLRFDATNDHVDMTRSTGVIGYRSFQSSLYVHLDAAKSHDIYLTQTRQNIPHLRDASFDALNWRRQGEAVTFMKSGWFRSEAVLSGLRPNAAYHVRADGKESRVVADRDGLLELKFETAENGGKPVEVKITRESL